MFGMKGFYVSASEAIQGHHCPLVTIILFIFGKNFMKLYAYIAYLKFHHGPLFFYLLVFQFDAMSWKKGVSCKMSWKKGLMQNHNFY